MGGEEELVGFVGGDHLAERLRVRRNGEHVSPVEDERRILRGEQDRAVNVLRTREPGRKAQVGGRKARWRSVEAQRNLDWPVRKLTVEQGLEADVAGESERGVERQASPETREQVERLQ